MRIIKLDLPTYIGSGALCENKFEELYDDLLSKYFSTSNIVLYLAPLVPLAVADTKERIEWRNDILLFSNFGISYRW